MCRVTTCMENLEKLGNLTAVSEMSGILLNVGGSVREFHIVWRVVTS